MMTFIMIYFQQIDSLSSVRLIIPKDLLPLEARENTLKKVSEVLTRFAKEGVPLLDPEDDMKVSEKFSFPLWFEHSTVFHVFKLNNAMKTPGSKQLFPEGNTKDRSAGESF